jgi:predicted Zn-dependent protease
VLFLPSAFCILHSAARLMRDERESFAILDRALTAAGTEADASFISVDQNISRFANSNVHQNMSEISAGLTLRVIVNGSIGVASTTVFDDDEIRRTAELAREAAKHASSLQNFSGLNRDNAPLPDVQTFDETTAKITPAEKARDLRTMFDRGRTHDVQFAGAYLTSHASVACANTHGVRRYAPLTFADSSVIALHARGSGYATRCARRANEVDVLSLGDEATTKATLRLDNIEDIEPGAFDVILEPPALGEVFEWMTMIAFTGQAYEDGSSFLVDHIGQRIVGENFTFADDAVDPSFLPFPFDLEGFAKRPVTLIERGIARTPMVDKAYADRLRLAPNGGTWHLGAADHGTSFHISIAGGDATREEMIASTKLGIWVTRFNYVNGLLEPKSALMTGTTRDGTFLIRDGQVAARLPNLRWTQSMIEALSNIESLTRERRRVATWYNMFGGTVAPVMKVRGWHFTGKSS